MAEITPQSAARRLADLLHGVTNPQREPPPWPPRLAGRDDFSGARPVQKSQRFRAVPGPA